jgi:PAS domain S-box-containing protein
LARVKWTLGTQVGSQSLLVGSGNLSPVTVTANASADNPASIQILNGNNQSSTRGAVLPDSLAVRVLDQYGNGVAGATVDWVVSLGGGSTSPTSSVANNTGRAATKWTLGNTGGPSTITATVRTITDTVTTAFTGAVFIVFETVSAAGRSSCGIDDGGVLFCWGFNGDGQMGIGAGPVGSGPVYTFPQAVTSVTAQSFASLNGGQYHHCAVTFSHVGYCWGDNNNGQLGINQPTRSAPEPTLIFTGLPFANISSGRSHTCGVTIGGRAWCWGSNERGQLGGNVDIDTTLNTVSLISTRAPAQVGSKIDGKFFAVFDFSAIAAGGVHTCAVEPAKSVRCWGLGREGQLGNGTNSVDEYVPQMVSTATPMDSITAGFKHSCSLSTTGEVFCWGDNTDGQLGVGNNNSQNVPAAVSGGPYVQVAAGYGHTCALSAGGQAFCWGRNDRGQLGDGTTTARNSPVAVGGGHAFKMISAGDLSTCGVTTGNVAYCWGDNEYGALGDGTQTHRSLPAKVRYQQYVNGVGASEAGATRPRSFPAPPSMPADRPVVAPPPDGLSSLLEALSSQLVVVDREGQIVAANGAWRDRTRIVDYFTAFQMVARPDYQLLEAVRRGLGAVLAGEQQEYVIEYPLPVDGERRWILLRAAPLAGSERRALIAHVDITGRKRAERLSTIQHEILSLVVADTPLRTTLDRLTTAIEAEAPGATCVVLVRSPDQGRVSVGAAPSLQAAIREELEGTTVAQLFHFVDGPASADLDQLPKTSWIAAALAYDLGGVTTMPVRAKSGTDLGIVMLFYRSPQAPPPLARTLLEVGSALAAIAIERNRTVRALQEREARLQSVFTLQPDAVFTLDARGEIIAVNPAAEQLMGEGSGDLAGQPLVDLISSHYRAGFQQHLQRALTGYPHRFTLALDPRVRGRLDIDATLVPLVADGGVGGVYVVAKDITEQLAAAERLAQSGKQLRQSAKMEAVGRLAGGIAHDFNNLLTAIRGYTELLLANDQLAGPPRQDLEEIVRAVGRAAGLTRQLLAFSRQQVVQPRRVDLSAVVEECRNMLARLVRADTEIVTSLTPEPGWVDADPIQIQQVLINLVVNAQDAMPSGGRITVEIGRLVAGLEQDDAIVTLEPGRYVTLTVSDTGKGIDPVIQSHIFEPFFTTKPPGLGTGLGLSTVYGIVEQSGGRVGFRSTPDRGTTFVIYLPAQRAPEGTTDRPTPADAFPTGTETILLAEDEEAVRTMVRKTLAAAGYTVLEARHGTDALLVSREYRGTIDLLLTDVVMPETNGLKLARAISLERPETQVVYMSGYTRDEVDRKGLMEPGVLFIHKPFTANELATTVRAAIDRGEGVRTGRSS